MAAGQLFAAADRVPFAGPGLPPLVLRRFRCQCRSHLKARGRLSERTLAGASRVAAVSFSGTRRAPTSPYRAIELRAGGTYFETSRHWNVQLSRPFSTLRAFRRSARIHRCQRFLGSLESSSRSTTTITIRRIFTRVTLERRSGLESWMVQSPGSFLLER